MIHTEEKSHKCKNCAFEFSHVDNLRRQKLTVHSVENWHNCKMCEKAFAQAYYLKRLILDHSEEKLLICKYFPYVYRSQRSHVFTHTNEKQYRYKAGWALLARI